MLCQVRAKRLAGDQVALQVELIVDGGMDRQDPLRAEPGDLKPRLTRSRLQEFAHHLRAARLSRRGCTMMSRTSPSSSTARQR